MATPVVMAIGDHWIISDWADQMTPEFSDTMPPSVVLTASIQSGPKPPIFPTLGLAATTLAIQMDARVAIELYEKLGNLGRSMGWLPQKEA